MSDLTNYRNFMSAMFLEVNPPRPVVTVKPLNDLLMAHDGAVDCNDQNLQRIVERELSEHPEWPAYKAEMDRLFQTPKPAQQPQPGDSDYVPF